MVAGEAEGARMCNHSMLPPPTLPPDSTPGGLPKPQAAWWTQRETHMQSSRSILEVY